jgi:redox-sensitive bicupin YhaK (pirin superfamily)
MIANPIVPRARDLGDGFTVRRALPSARCRNVGPFVFFDQIGPVAIGPGRGLDVRPHPHIGLATVTYLFEGEILHRDSLGFVQPIRPGEVNWMTAGRGIVHSERTPEALRVAGSRLSGVQIWVALPRPHEEDAPSFAHHADLPAVAGAGARARVILGRMLGVSSPVQTLSEMFYADVVLERGARVPLPADYAERAVYVIEGTLTLDGTSAAAGELLVLERDSDTAVATDAAARVLLFGGEPLDAPRFVWWNFVSSRKERIAAAAADWKAGRIGVVPGETECIPLPAEAPALDDSP